MKNLLIRPGKGPDVQLVVQHDKVDISGLTHSASSDWPKPVPEMVTSHGVSASDSIPVRLVQNKSCQKSKCQCSSYGAAQLSSRWVKGIRTGPPAHECMEDHLHQIFLRKKNTKAKSFGRNTPRSGTTRDLISAVDTPQLNCHPGRAAFKCIF